MASAEVDRAGEGQQMVINREGALTAEVVPVLNGVEQAFFAHKKHLEQGPRIVTRASAVFYFRSTPGKEGVRTQVHFLNYWREKSGLVSLTQRLTLRTLEGETFLVNQSLIEGRGGHVLEVDELLAQSADSPTEGSIEIEFLSETSLGMAYPALVVRYVGHDWHTLAHSCQRFYSESSADDHVGELQLAEEGNITIQEDAGIEPFLFVHNGPSAVEARPIEIDIIAEDGRRFSSMTDPIDWRPFQTRQLLLRDLVEYREFLAGQRGTFSIRLVLAGVFPRLIGGQERSGTWSIDHTNFSAIAGAAAQDVIQVSPDPDHRELVFNVPNNLDEDWHCFVDIYPTYPEDDGYTIEVRTIDKLGKTVVARDIALARFGDQSFPRITVDNTASGRETTLSLTYRHQSSLPRRFHTGIHYQIGEGLPGFLTDGPMPASSGSSRTHWFPVFEQPDSRNFLLVSNLSSGNEQQYAVTYDCLLFNIFGDDPLEEVFRLEAFEQKCLPLNDLIPDANGFLRDGPGWVYMVAREPQRAVLHYASVRGQDSIAVCHAF